MDYPIFPESSVAITTYYKDPTYPKKYGTHYGIDMAYQKKYYSGPKNIYAIWDGEVTEVVNPEDATKLKWCNIRHTINGKSVISRYFHFSKLYVVKGDKVKMGDIIGIEGKSGEATDSHLEIQYWIVPADYTYKAGDTSKYAVDPLDYLYLGDGQECVYDPNKRVQTKPTWVEIPCEEGTTFKCLVADALNYRTSPEIKKDNKCGLLPTGAYTAVATTENDGYLWCKFCIPNSSETRYAAILDGYSELVIPIDYEILYKEEVAKNEELTAKNDALQTENNNLIAEIGVCNEKLAEVNSALKILKKYGE